MRWFKAHWTYDAKGDLPAWRCDPAAHIFRLCGPCEIDGENPGKRTEGQIAGVGVACVTSGEPVPDTWELIGEGQPGEIKSSQKMIDAFPRRTGYTPQGENLGQLLLDAFTTGSSPDGSDFTKPIIPEHNGTLRLSGAGLNYTRKFRYGVDGHTNRVRDVLRAGFREAWNDYQSGKIVADKPLMVLGGMLKKYGLTKEQFQTFVPLDLRQHVAEAKDPQTTYTDNFNRADATLTSPWALVTGTPSVASNRVRGNTSSETTAAARYDSALSSSDNYSQIVGYSAASGNGIGPYCRMPSSGQTGYFVWRALTSGGELYRESAGSLVQIGTGWTGAHADGDVMKTDANGSTITGYKNGGVVRTGTNTDLASGLYCGIRFFHNTVRGDDFECGDLGGGGGPTSWIRSPFISRVFRSPVIRGVRC